MLPSAKACEVAVALIGIGVSHFQPSQRILPEWGEQPHGLCGIQFSNKIFILFVARDIPCSMAAVVVDKERLIPRRGRRETARGLRIVAIVAACQFDMRQQFLS